MPTWAWIAIGLGALLTVYAAFVGWLYIVGRHSDARAVARFIPDCIVLLRRLLADGRVSRWRKLLVVGLIVYLALPFDLVPDFIPIAGQLDDAMVVAIVLRVVLRGGGPEVLREHWPGESSSRDLMLRLAYGRRRSTA
jgi:uncharacterized membrane protein YkvA (DUF1232 family)